MNEAFILLSGLRLKLLMARNLFRIFTENKPIRGLRKKYNIPDVNWLKEVILLYIQPHQFGHVDFHWWIQVGRGKGGTWLYSFVTVVYINLPYVKCAPPLFGVPESAHVVGRKTRWSYTMIPKDYYLNISSLTSARLLWDDVVVAWITDADVWDCDTGFSSRIWLDGMFTFTVVTTWVAFDVWTVVARIHYIKSKLDMVWLIRKMQRNINNWDGLCHKETKDGF